MKIMDYQQIIKAQDTRLKNLKDSLSKLIFFNQSEIAQFLKKMQFMPKEAFDEMSQLIAEEKEKQDDFLYKMIKKDPNFNKKFKKEILKHYQAATKKVEEKESAEADNLLDKLQNL